MPQFWLKRLTVDFVIIDFALTLPTFRLEGLTINFDVIDFIFAINLDLGESPASSVTISVSTSSTSITQRISQKHRPRGAREWCISKQFTRVCKHCLVPMSKDLKVLQ